MDSTTRAMGIIGASGFLGRALARESTRRGWRVVGFSRSARAPGEDIAEWRPWDGKPRLAGLDAVVNLAGEPINRRWTAAARARFHASRIGVTQSLIEAMRGNAPEVLVNASAVGIYGDRGDEELTEVASSGEGYLAELCRAWEEAADAAPCRVVKLRIGVVLGHGGMAWDQLRRVQ